VERIDEDKIVKDFLLEQNYPNPFNPSTEIKFHIAQQSFVTLKIYDLLGREIETLVSEELDNGVYIVDWNGDNNFGEKVSSGIYFYRIEAGSFINSMKMLLLK
jgi:flagellar hook assembly protein FlgD